MVNNLKQNKQTAIDINYTIRYLYHNKKHTKAEIRKILKHILPKHKVPNKKVNYFYSLIIYYTLLDLLT